MKNFVKVDDPVTATMAADTAAGAGVLIGLIFGVAANTVKNGEANELVTRGVFDLPKVSPQAWATVGLAIYWDNTAKNLTTTSSGNTKVGVNVLAAGSNATVGRVRLNGVF